MEERCATCRHWHHDKWTLRLATNWFPDDGMRFSGWGECQLARPHEPHPTTKAIAFDHERYEANLLTAPDFGCVQWEATP